MYFKEFDIRWSDLDPNWHLANSAYISFMSHTRMSFLMENGFGKTELMKHKLGPVVFYEHIYYFREILPGQKVKVSLQLKGLSEDGMYFEFVHEFYDRNGKNLASCELMGGWINLETRKLTGLPKTLLDNFGNLERSPDFKILTKEDTRKHGKHPKDISRDLL
ncbi:MAG TPA: thioesterase family protein [Salinimicrobium sp.]|nr:thioesterase family protein [Salinimicrobium sp.]